MGLEWQFVQAHGIVEITDASGDERRLAKAASWETLKDLVFSGRWLAIAAGYDRPGTLNYTTTLEHKYYKPNTQRNTLFKLFCCLFDDMLFAVVLIPWNERALAHKHARKCGMRIADGIPTVLSMGDGDKVDVLQFPTGDHPHIFTLENRPGAPVHGMQPESLNQVIREEIHQVREFVAERVKVARGGK